MKKVNELLEIRNELVSKEDQVEMYDLVDAVDTEDTAVEGLTKEIHQLLNVWMKIDPTEAARYRKNLMRVFSE